MTLISKSCLATAVMMYVMIMLYDHFPPTKRFTHLSSCDMHFSSPLSAGTLVWVLKSKGASKSDGRSDLFMRARVVRNMEDGDRVLVRSVPI